MPGPYGVPIPVPSPHPQGNWIRAVPNRSTPQRTLLRVPGSGDPVLDVIEGEDDPYQNDLYQTDTSQDDPYENDTHEDDPYYQNGRPSSGAGNGQHTLTASSGWQRGTLPTQPANNAPQVPPSVFPRTTFARGGLRVLLSKHARYQDERERGVKYIDNAAVRRAKYQIEIGARLRRRGSMFDTREVRKHFERKYRSRGEPNILGAANLGEGHATPQEWIEKALIWVCAVDPLTDRPAFYSHVGKVHRFHHSSLVGGGEVIGAGEWIVEKGKLMKISANSGHYQPTIDFLYRSVLHLAPAFHKDTMVFLYDRFAKKWVEREISDFIRSPSGGGRYWAHPRSQA